MKNLKPIALLLFVVFTMTSCLDLLRETVEGSGNVIKKEDYDISGFSKISIAAGIKAYVKTGDTESIVVEADDNILELIKVEIKGDKLSVYINENVKSYKKMDVYITAKQLEAVQASSAANVNVEGVINVEKLSCSVSSSGNIAISANVTDFQGNASSAGQINIGEMTANKTTLEMSSAAVINIDKGAIENLKANASSAGSLNASDVDSQTSDVSVSSGGSININVIKTLFAEASSGGSVNFKGSPSVEKMNTSSGGSINKQ